MMIASRAASRDPIVHALLEWTDSLVLSLSNPDDDHRLPNAGTINTYGFNLRHGTGVMSVIGPFGF